jgi:hypothetical protein
VARVLARPGQEDLLVDAGGGEDFEGTAKIENFNVLK